MWLFKKKSKPFEYSPMLYAAPDYFDSEKAGLLSDGRYSVPTYTNNKFMGRFPQDPFLNERIGEYRWGQHAAGDWVWLHEPTKENN